jgi:hypothetical protein
MSLTNHLVDTSAISPQGFSPSRGEAADTGGLPSPGKNADRRGGWAPLSDRLEHRSLETLETDATLRARFPKNDSGAVDHSLRLELMTSASRSLRAAAGIDANLISVYPNRHGPICARDFGSDLHMLERNTN